MRPRLIAVALMVASVALGTEWWDGGILGHLPYRVPIEIVNGDTPKDDYPVTIELNFTTKLSDVGEFGALDEGAIRIIKAMEGDSVASGVPVPHLLERAPDFTLISNANSWVSWIIDGRIEPQERVVYHLYFDIQAHGVKLEAVPLPWEAVFYNPANMAQGGSFEPEAASVDQSRNPWRGWGPAGRPVSITPYNTGHLGRWSLALVPGEDTAWEVLIGLLEPGRSYLLGGFIRVSPARDDLGTLTLNFSLGGARPIRFSKEQPLGPPMGWWRSEIPLPIAPESPVFSVVFDFQGTMPDTLWIDDLFVYEDPPMVSIGPGERQ